MRNTLDTLWAEGQALETSRDLLGARQIYERIVAIDASHIAARLRLSRFAQVFDEYVLARRHVIEAADAIRSGASTRLVAFVTQRLLDFAEESEVAALTLSLDWADPELLRQAAPLAQHLWLSGRYEDALRFLDSVEPRLSPNALLLLTRANVLRYLGNMQEASRHYHRALEVEPALVDAHWALATHERDPAPPLRLERLRAAARNHTRGSIEAAHLRYAQFRDLDHLDRRTEAWAALQRGASIMAFASRHDASRDHQALRRLETLGCQPSQADSGRPAQPTPLFIVGLPRTGTTLLDRILGNHGWVSSTGERNDFAAAVSEVSDHFFGTLLQEELPSTFLDIDLKQVGHLYVQRLRRHASATAYAIDKNPQNLFNLPLIVRALPNAKILILERDPMDAAFSNLKELFQGGAYAYSYDFASLAVRTSGAMRLAHDWQKQNPGAIRIVPYAALVQTPDETIKHLLEFIGLPPADGLTDITSNRSAVTTASSSQVREPLNTRALGAWRRYASELAPLQALLEKERGANVPRA